MKSPSTSPCLHCGPTPATSIRSPSGCIRTRTLSPVRTALLFVIPFRTIRAIARARSNGANLAIWFPRAELRAYWFAPCSSLAYFPPERHPRMRDLSLRQIGAMDMGSRRVLGFALGEHRDAALAYGALATAAAFRGHPGARRDRAHDQGSEPAKASWPASSCQSPVRGQVRVSAG